MHAEPLQFDLLKPIHWMKQCIHLLLQPPAGARGQRDDAAVLHRAAEPRGPKDRKKYLSAQRGVVPCVRCIWRLSQRAVSVAGGMLASTHQLHGDKHVINRARFSVNWVRVSSTGDSFVQL
jgi:hypothetical protein